MADGLFLESGYFFVMPKVNLGPLRELFRGHVLKMQEKEGLIGDNFIKMIMVWQHVSGFNVHNQVRIKPDDEKGMENLSQYIKERRNQRAPPAVIQENTELIWIVPYDDGWPNYEEPVFEY